ncbi:dipeptidase [Labrenzia sp. DG1229]|uniref:dipeptidase n=1 Tax=Labrenzia sp. DG1229 TaxID=681847 RepID=UPI00256FAF75|nr:dipeptidase [Labrenzia sp. DG1229]
MLLEVTQVFDGHNDVLSALERFGVDEAVQLFEFGCDTALDLVKAQRGGFAGGLFAVYVPDDRNPANLETLREATYHIPNPKPIHWTDALARIKGQVALLLELKSRGLLKLCLCSADIRQAMNSNRLAAVLHVEGADLIDPELHVLELLYAAGMRSLGLVWNRPTIFAQGVPYSFPSSPNIGDGLSKLGRQLVLRCNQLGIIVDLSHINEAGFWDVAEVTSHPLVASHSNSHAICPHARNLTDNQLRAIASTNGIVGINFSVSFLRDDGRKLSDVPIDQVLRHFDHLLGILGEDCIGLGSDYDGTITPREIADVSTLPKLINAMQKHGYGDELVEKICRANWLRVLKTTWEECGSNQPTVEIRNE